MIGNISKRTLKIVMLAKVLLVLVVIGVEFEFFYFGDKPVAAQVGSDAAARGARTNTESDSKRRGFLDDLLSVPKIDTSDLRREEVARYLELVERRQRQVEERISLLENRENLLRELEKNVEDKLSRLDEERRFFAETVQNEKVVGNDRLKQLVEFYRGMPPKQAAPVFEKLDNDLVVALFTSLPEKQITSILGVMDPERAVELTEYYGRLRSGKEYDLLKEVNASLVEAFQDCKGLPATSH